MGSSNNPAWSSRYITSLWSETSRTWDSGVEDWRVVGSNPFRGREDRRPGDCSSMEILYIIEYSSGRLGIAYGTGDPVETNTYVILEADRGEDCGLVIGTTTKDTYIDLLNRYKIAYNEFKLMRVFRVATKANVLMLEERKQITKAALIQCRSYACSKGLNMEILDCEYQFDKNKITFFYRSAERIDFRDLVKDLYKAFKTRIWMCSLDKSKVKYLSSLLESSSV